MAVSEPLTMNGNGNDSNGQANREREECEDCLVRQKLQPGDPDEPALAIPFTRREAVCRRTFLVTRLTLGAFNLTSLCLKLPLIVLIVRMVVEMAQAKASEAQVTTIEPPYEEEGNQQANPDSKSQKRECCSLFADAVRLRLTLPAPTGADRSAVRDRSTLRR